MKTQKIILEIETEIIERDDGDYELLLPEFKPNTQIKVLSEAII